MILTPPPELGVQRSSKLIQDAQELVRESMSSNDPSHDYLHIERVRAMALRLAQSHVEGPLDVVVVELGALFHDMIDHKYVATGKREALVNALSTLMMSNGLSAERTALVIQIVENTGYSIEKRLRAHGEWTAWHDTCPEYHCVQDADRLDAIGAMGIFRVSCYAACTREPLIEAGNPNTVDQHFHDKLLQLKGTLHTPLGRKVAENRQQIMEQFVASVRIEAQLLDFVDY